MKNFILLTLLAGFLSHSSHAEKKVTTDSIKINSGKIEFYALGKPSMLKIHGTAKSLEGSLDKKNTEITGHFIAKMDDFSSGLTLRDSHTKNKVFEVEKYPTAEMTLKPMECKSGEKTKFTGVLKFHGIEKEVQGETTINLNNGLTNIQSNFNILLTDFNIQPPEFAGMKINNEVRVEVSGDSSK